MDARLGVGGGNLLQRDFQPGAGLDAVHLGGLDERSDATPGGGALVVTREQCVPGGQSHRRDPVLRNVRLEQLLALLAGATGD